MPKQERHEPSTSIQERIEVAKAGLETDKRPNGPVGQANIAWRMVIDLVAGVGIGAAVGYGLDRLLGTQPWLMSVFLLLGFAAGVNLMLRTAKEVGNKDSLGQGPEN